MSDIHYVHIVATLDVEEKHIFICYSLLFTEIHV